MAKTLAKRTYDIFAVIALCATCWLAMPASEANAATNAKQRIVQPAKKPEVKKEAAKKDAKPAREASGKKASAKKVAHRKGKPVKHAAKAKRGKKPAADDDDDEDEKKPSTPPLTGDLAVVKKVIDLARDGETEDATEAAKAIEDPAGQKLAEWFILRHSETQARFAAFLSNNPTWPSITLMRRRAEARLWQEKANVATIRTFFADKGPLTAK